MGEVWGRRKKYLQIVGLRWELVSSQSSDIAGDCRGLGSEIELLPNRKIAQHTERCPGGY
jgi:hypothetical protein